MFPKNLKGNEKFYIDKIREFLKNFPRPWVRYSIMLRYLQVLEKYDLFTSHTFPTTYIQIDSNGREIIRKTCKIGVRPFCIFFIEEYSCKTFGKYDFSEVIEFKGKDNEICFKTSDKIRHVCQSSHSKWIEKMVKGYVEMRKRGEYEEKSE